MQWVGVALARTHLLNLATWHGGLSSPSYCAGSVTRSCWSVPHSLGSQSSGSWCRCSHSHSSRWSFFAVTEKKNLTLNIQQSYTPELVYCLGVLLFRDEDCRCPLQLWLNDPLDVLNRVHWIFTLGQFLFSLYGIMFGPGADADVACLTACLTSLSLDGDVSKSTYGSVVFGT